jgi:hypothetical protein
MRAAAFTASRTLQKVWPSAYYGEEKLCLEILR